MSLAKKLLPFGLAAFLAASPILAKDKICYEFRGKILYIYNVKENGKNNSARYSNKGLEDKIRNAKINYFSDNNLPPDDYFTSLYALQYFDTEKAKTIADKYGKEKKLKPGHKDLFVKACRKWPFINFYSNKRNIDSKIVFWVAATENKFEPKKGSFGETGDMQIMPKTAQSHIREWKKDPYWIKGFGVEHPINNYIAGISILDGSTKKSGVSGKIRNNNTEDVIAIYSFYSRNRDHFYDYEKAFSNFANSTEFLYMIPLVHEASANGNLITAAGKRKLQRKYLLTFGKNYRQERMD